MSVTEEEEGGVSEVQAHIGDWGGRWSNSCEQKFVLIVVVADKEIFLYLRLDDGCLKALFMGEFARSDEADSLNFFGINWVTSG